MCAYAVSIAISVCYCVPVCFFPYSKSAGAEFVSKIDLASTPMSHGHLHSTWWYTPHHRLATLSCHELHIRHCAKQLQWQSARHYCIAMHTLRSSKCRPTSNAHYCCAILENLRSITCIAKQTQPLSRSIYAYLATSFSGDHQICC
jgi:hypothetical protein